MANTPPEKTRVWTLPKFIPWLFFIGGGVALIASFLLTKERLDILANPAYRPVCNLNPIFSCSTVSSSSQAHLFGFYNPLLGLAGYAAIMSFGLVLLAGAELKRWLWRLIQAGMTFAIGFITWLQFETLYRIGALCLFCMITWAMTMPMFWYTTLYNLDSGHIRLAPRYPRLAAFVRRHHADILILWYLLIIALILKRFWYYWSTL